jgi:FHS family glucose/mannose:H+ symporter-like MFS transporter
MTFTKTHFVGYLGYISIGLINSIIGPAIPYLINEFGMNFSLIGTLFFIQFTFYFTSVLTAGVASDFFGKKPFLLIGASLMAAGLIGLVFSKNESTIFLFIAFIGAGFGILDGGLNSLFIDISGEQKGFGLGLLHMFFGIGALSGPLIFSLASKTFLNWRFAFLIASCIPILFFALFFPIRLLKVKSNENMRISDVTILVKNNIIVQFIFLLFAYVGVEQAIAGWLPTYLIKILNVSYSTGSFTLSLFFIGLTIGRLLIGLISEKIGYSNTLLTLSLGASIFLLLIFISNSVNPIIIFFMLSGFFLSGIFPTAMALVGSIFPKYSGSLSGILTAAGGIGGMLLPFGMGVVSDYAGLKQGLFVPILASITMFFLAVLSFGYLKGHKGIAGMNPLYDGS